MPGSGQQRSVTASVTAILLASCGLAMTSCAGRAPVTANATPPPAERKYRAADVQRAIDQLSNTDASTRQHAAYVLNEMGPDAQAAVHPLIALVKSDPSMGVRGQAAQALGRIGPAAETAVPALVAFLQDLGCGYERTYAASALGDIGAHADVAVPALTTALERDPEPVVRRLAAMALGDFHAGASASLPAVAEAVLHGDQDLRSAGILALKGIPARPEDVATLLPLLDDEIDDVRAAAARSIGGAGEGAAMAVPRMVRLLQDPNDRVCVDAAIGLGEIGAAARDAVPALEHLLKTRFVSGHADVSAALKKIRTDAGR